MSSLSFSWALVPCCDYIIAYLSRFVNTFLRKNKKNFFEKMLDIPGKM